MVVASLVAQRLKHQPALWDTWVQSLGQEDPMEKEMATHSSILAWRIPWIYAPLLLSEESNTEKSESVSHSLMFDSLRPHGL